MALIDTHCHLDMVLQRGLSLQELMRRATEENVSRIVQIGVDPANSKEGRDLVRKWNQKPGSLPVRLFWAAGIHPESVEDGSQINELNELLQQECGAEDLCAVGEAGLDYFHNSKNRELQKERLRQQMDLARSMKLPLVMHLRDERVYNPDNVEAIHDARELLKEFPDVKGVLHCYTYSPKEAMPFVEMGWMVSFSGIVTYKNATNIQDTACGIPLTSVLVETDAPFLAPDPFRGKVNEPSYANATLRFVASLRSEKLGEKMDYIKEQIYTNTMTFFGWD